MINENELRFVARPANTDGRHRCTGCAFDEEDTCVCPAPCGSYEREDKMDIIWVKAE